MLLNNKYYLSNVENVICTQYHKKDNILHFTFLMFNFYETIRIYNYCIKYKLVIDDTLLYY